MQIEVSVLKKRNKTANSGDPDETAHYESSHLDLHSLHTEVLVLVCHADRVKGRKRKVYK